MRTLGQSKLQSFRRGFPHIVRTTNYNVRARPGLEVHSYPDLVERISLLSFHNPEQVLFFRGQKAEYTTSKNNSSIKPSIFRPVGNRRTSPKGDAIRHRYTRLREAEKLVIECFLQHNLLGKERVIRSRILQWAIIQHYEICGTPLLDVTHSLRVAASFATLDSSWINPMLYVLAAPSLGGTISASSEQGIQTIRLSSICPPCAKRPHFQEGYLLAEYPDLNSFDEKQLYKPHEIDFGLRLLAKFHLKPESFWNNDFLPIPKVALFPNHNDPLFEHTEKIKSQLIRLFGPE